MEDMAQCHMLGFTLAKKNSAYKVSYQYLFSIVCLYEERPTYDKVGVKDKCSKKHISMVV